MGLKEKKKNFNHKLTLDEVLDALVEAGLVGPEQSVFIKKKKGRSKIHPLLSIIDCDVRDFRDETKILSIEALTKWLAEYAEMEYEHIDPLKIDIGKVTNILPKAYITRTQVLPIEVTDDTVTFVTAEPFFNEWQMDAERISRKKLIVKIASPQQISSLINEFYTVHAAIKNLNKDSTDASRTGEMEKMLGKSGSTISASDDKGISGVVDWLFQYAFDERATDMHFEPKQGIGHIRFRIDGTLKEVYKLQPDIMLSVLSRIKLMAGMKIDEKRKPQDGRIKREIGEEKVIEIRASTIPSHYGEKLVLRIFDSKMAEKGISEIGFAKKDITLWNKLATHSYGMLLVTGPTGSGKSTTLHATLQELASPEVNICTAEDPIEIINDKFNQMQINHNIELDFSSAIRAFMRQDPDIIMVGEIRDAETSEMAVQAALTGHMVFSTLHTNDALSSFTRLLDLGIPPHLINACIRGVLAQRLVRVLCPHCKEETDCPEPLWKTLTAPYKVKMPEKVFKAVGCSECKNSGYYGRNIVYELVPLTDKIRKVIHENVELSELQKAAHGSFLPMRLNGAQKVIDGITNIEEVLRVVV